MNEHLPTSRHFRLEQLGGGMYAAIHKDGGAAISNAGIVDLGERTLVFDSLFTPQAAHDLRRAAKALAGRPIAAVINSHSHNDHIWGNQAFSAGTENSAGTEIIASDATRRQIVADVAGRVYDGFLDNAEARLAAAQARRQAAGSQEQPRQLGAWVDYQQAVVDLKPILKVRAPTLTFSGRLAFHGSARSAELLEFSAGHSESDAVLWLPQERIAFMGDLLFTGHHPYLGDGDPDSLQRILREVAAMQPRLVVPGHGPLGAVQDIDLMRQYVRMVDGLARRLVENGDGEESIDGLAIPPPFETWLLPGFFAANLHALYRRRLQKPR